MKPQTFLSLLLLPQLPRFCNPFLGAFAVQTPLCTDNRAPGLPGDARSIDVLSEVNSTMASARAAFITPTSDDLSVGSFPAHHLVTMRLVCRRAGRARPTRCVLYEAPSAPRGRTAALRPRDILRGPPPEAPAGSRSKFCFPDGHLWCRDTSVEPAGEPHALRWAGLRP